MTSYKQDRCLARKIADNDMIYIIIEVLYKISNSSAGGPTEEFRSPSRDPREKEEQEKGI